MQQQDTFTLSRRGFLKGAIVIGSSVIVAGATLGAGIAAAEGEGSLAGVQYGFLVNLDKCVGCEKCVMACREANHLSEETPDRRVVQVFTDSNQMDVYCSTSCMHCADPSCMRVCPAGAISKGDAGIVATDKDKCIGCKYCYQACPYSVPHYNSVAMDKCDCCLDAGVTPGETPYCVRACIFNALTYGPIDELVAKAKDAVQVGQPNDPSCWLVGGEA